MKRTLAIASLLIFNLSCTNLGLQLHEITQCPTTESMAPRITESCEASWIEDASYYRQLSESLLSQNVYPRRLDLMLAYGDDRAVDSICILNFTEVNLESRLRKAIRAMSKVRPRKRLSCLSNHHAQISFSWSIQWNENGF